jgi:acetyl-CoA carboxylase biotin carboxyl carrier protein
VSLTGRDVAQILQALEQSSFDTLDLELDGVQLHLRRGGAAPAPGLPAAAGTAGPNTSPQPAGPVPAPTASSAGDTRPLPRGDATPVPAPLLGIYYRAPRPGEAPFVQVGDRVQADSIIGIIEVMKLMNPVPAGVAGEVVQISAGNGELVEYGQALLWIRRD